MSHCHICPFVMQRCVTAHPAGQPLIGRFFAPCRSELPGSALPFAVLMQAACVRCPLAIFKSILAAVWEIVVCCIEQEEDASWSNQSRNCRRLYTTLLLSSLSYNTGSSSSSSSRVWKNLSLPSSSLNYQVLLFFSRFLSMTRGKKKLFVVVCEACTTMYSCVRRITPQEVMLFMTGF